MCFRDLTVPKDKANVEDAWQQLSQWIRSLRIPTQQKSHCEMGLTELHLPAILCSGLHCL